MLYVNAIEHRHMPWADVEAAVDRLVRDIKDKQEEPIRTIIGVAKGGVIPASLVHQAFPDASFHTIEVVSYDENNKQHKPAVLLTWNKAQIDILNHPSTIIVDDIQDTGETHKALHEFFNLVNFGFLVVKNSVSDDDARLEYDFLGDVVEHNVWVHFPWEPLKDDGQD